MEDLLDQEQPPPPRVTQDTTHGQEPNGSESNTDVDYTCVSFVFEYSSVLCAFSPSCEDIQNQARRMGS